MAGVFDSMLLYPMIIKFEWLVGNMESFTMWKHADHYLWIPDAFLHLTKWQNVYLSRDLSAKEGPEFSK